MPLLKTILRHWWLLLPVLALAGGYGWQTGAIQRGWCRISGGPPAIDFPALIDLGERTANEVILHRFEISNLGGQDLVIDQIRSSCSCGKLEEEIDGHSISVERLQISPGDRAEVIVRLTARTDGAGTFNQSVSFATNDPARPEVRIKLAFHTLSGGTRSSPAAVQFGRVPLGHDSRQVVDIVDRDGPSQTVARVVCADEEGVTVQWVPVTQPEQRAEGHLIGRIEVVANAARPRPLDTTILVAFADPKIQPLSIPVSGRVVPRMDVSPESLLLPRSSGSGPVYTAKCLVRERDGVPFQLDVIPSDPDLRVELSGAAEGANKVLQITWVPAPTDDKSSVRKTVRLRAKVGEEEVNFEIPVTCERPN